MCKLYCKPCATEFDGTPCAVKAARTVWSRGKVEDHIKDLPMAIWRKVAGHEAAHGWGRSRVGRHYPDSPAERSVWLRTAGGGCRPVHIIIRKAIVTISHTEGEVDERDFIVSRQ